ncbi:hypothetical protein L211DRAFT_850729 [Terfezia boudieri ATCC MYA-4762]|uniref:Uncharacterized protein n=1 Tax=Terfezia boudieri ATCC MYA-4762 TaxID=1051890 RepID=A0A3N4LHQ7_9PEZI|nr:hypothetical protein L211DRAFT_850729 [Terfezia boudieri ATCC MYA-4762]
MSSTSSHADDLLPKHTSTPTTHPDASSPSGSNAVPLAQPASESSPLLPQVEVPAQVPSRYRIREEFLFVFIFYILVEFLVFGFLSQCIVYRARMQELREFGPEEGILTKQLHAISCHRVTENLQPAANLMVLDNEIADPPAMYFDKLQSQSCCSAGTFNNSSFSLMYLQKVLCQLSHSQHPEKLTGPRRSNE